MNNTHRGLEVPALLFILLVTSCRSVSYQFPMEKLIFPPDDPPVWNESDYSGISRLRYRDTEQPVSLSVLRIDLGSGLYELVQTEPDPTGKGETRCARVSEFVRDYQLIAGMNAAPFGPSNILNRKNLPSEIAGLMLIEGMFFSSPVPYFDALYMTESGNIMIASQDASPPEAYWGIGGFHIALKNGNVTGIVDTRHPRSVVGISRDGNLLYLAVFDGRQKDAAGVTTEEIGLWMAWLGAYDAINMDGGGSSALVLNENGEYRLLNTPIHRGKPGLERSVASHIGISLRKK